jgi:hypothetical protein
LQEKLKNWKKIPIITTATDTEEPRARNSEEVKGSLEAKEEKQTTVDKATDTETGNNYMRILIKTVKILTYTILYVKAAKELKMLQQNSQMTLIISFQLNKIMSS